MNNRRTFIRALLLAAMICVAGNAVAQVLPSAPADFGHSPASAELKKVVLRVYPGREGDDNTFTLYEDDGVTSQYEKDAYAKTKLNYRQADGKVCITISAAEGSYEGQLQSRGYELQLCGFAGERVTVDIPETSIRNEIKVEFPLERPVGTTISVFHGLGGLTRENLIAARKKGVECIEISLSGLVNGDKALGWTELKKRFAEVKKAADEAGVRIWSIHMPYEKECDPSHPDSKTLRKGLEKYRRCIDAVSVLRPHILLYHPSFYQLEHGDRDKRIETLGKSMRSLSKWGKQIGAETVIENMLGPTVERTDGYARAIGRNLDEMQKIMKLVPKDVGVAIDTNHATDPVALIRHFGSRVHTLHVCDGNGQKDRHAMPGGGSVDWNGVLSALNDVGYRGPFLYEVKSKEVSDIAELKVCYDRLYANWLKENVKISINK